LPQIVLPFGEYQNILSYRREDYGLIFGKILGEAMTDDSHIPRRLEGEYENILGFNTVRTAAAPPPAVDFTESGASAIGRVSLEAVVNVLIKRGLCTENELLMEENRLHAQNERLTQENRLYTQHETTPQLDFTPVQIQHEDYEHGQIQHESYEHKRHDYNRLRRWASKHQWSRRLGTLLFGWKWHRRKRAQ
jgi:hypothetical protein